MRASDSEKKPKRFHIICIAATAAIILVVLALFIHQRNQVAPILVLDVEGLSAETPAQAQIQCRADCKRYQEYMKYESDCSWVWCGGSKLYLTRSEALHIDTAAESTGFTAVTFKDKRCKDLHGYIIEPQKAGNELGRIQIEEDGEYTFDNVSMSVRVALREGKIAYANAVYLWEKGSAEVIVAAADSYTVIDGGLVSFADDGGEIRICYILDTKLD